MFIESGTNHGKFIEISPSKLKRPENAEDVLDPVSPTQFPSQFFSGGRLQIPSAPSSPRLWQQHRSSISLNFHPDPAGGVENHFFPTNSCFHRDTNRASLTSEASSVDGVYSRSCENLVKYPIERRVSIFFLQWLHQNYRGFTKSNFYPVILEVKVTGDLLAFSLLWDFMRKEKSWQEFRDESQEIDVLDTRTRRSSDKNHNELPTLFLHSLSMN